MVYCFIACNFLARLRTCSSAPALGSYERSIGGNVTTNAESGGDSGAFSSSLRSLVYSCALLVGTLMACSSAGGRYLCTDSYDPPVAPVITVLRPERKRTRRDLACLGGLNTNRRYGNVEHHISHTSPQTHNDLTGSDRLAAIL